MKYHTIINFFPEGVQVDAGRRRRFPHGALVEQGPHTYVVERVRISRRREQTVDLYRQP